MSKVIPTKPGWWWLRHHGVGPIVGYVDLFGKLCLYDAKQPTPVTAAECEWLAPVPSVEAVQAAVEAMMNACRKMEDAGWHPCEGLELSNAIAGLTGGEKG